MENYTIVTSKTKEAIQRIPQSIQVNPTGMTDFGGRGNGGTIAECELNIPEQSVVGCSTLTSSDLNELGCTSSTSAKSGSSGISSAGTSHRRNSLSQPHTTVRSTSLLSIFRRSRSTAPTLQTRSRSTTTHSPRALGPRSKTTHTNSSTKSNSKIFIDVLRSFTNGFSNCSKKRNNEEGGNSTRRGSNSCASDELSNNLDILNNQFAQSTGRRKSHDGSHDGTNGSDSTSTGYVSDSSNEKHYPKNKHNTSSSSSAKSSPKPKPTVLTISQQIDEAQAAAEMAWNEVVKATDLKKQEEKPTNDKTNFHKTQGPSNLPPREIFEVEKPQEKICYIASSASEEELSGTEDSMYTSGTESVSSDYETNETSSYEDDIDEKEMKAVKVSRSKTLDIIREEDEEESQTVAKAKGVRRRKSTLKRKRTLKEDDLKSGMKSTLASLKAKDEDAVSRTGSLKDMIFQFETAVAALEIGECRETEVQKNETPMPVKSPLQGVKAIAQKIQEQTWLEYEEKDVLLAQQLQKHIASMKVEESDLAKPVPLSRRSESKVAQIARQLAAAETQRVKTEQEVEGKTTGKESPKDIMKKQSSTSFINELLEMARAESTDKIHDASNHEEAPDFKQSLLAARKKITHREEVETKKSQSVKKLVSQFKAQNASPMTIQPTLSASSLSSTDGTFSEGSRNVQEEIDPFVKEVLRSKTVPEPVKQKIRIECWSLFNDPRTPKGVKQCILATMLSKVQNE